jgi:hypothetical protein
VSAVDKLPSRFCCLRLELSAGTCRIFAHPLDEKVGPLGIGCYQNGFQALFEAIA